ncbi:MAG: non-homologous end-joining DNA ligase [Gelidibacter sp.]
MGKIKNKTLIKIAGIEISHPEKVLFPSLQITKLEVVKYYESVADRMLPFMKNRVITINRFPDGIKSQGFYQKKAADYYPEFIKTISVKTEEGINKQFICNDKKSLLYLVNQGTIGFHIWLSKIDKLDKPDKVVFDLDPSDFNFENVKRGATIVAEFLRNKHIEPKLMTTGQNGLHVWYKIRRTKTYEELRPELKIMAEQLEYENPNLFTTSLRKNKREGKIFIDYLRNAYAQTSVCPYSLRPNKQAGIAMPLEWKVLNSIKKSSEFNYKNQSF